MQLKKGGHFFTKISCKSTCILAWSMNTKMCQNSSLSVYETVTDSEVGKLCVKFSSDQRNLASKQVRCFGKGQSSHYRIKDSLRHVMWWGSSAKRMAKIPGNSDACMCVCRWNSLGVSSPCFISSSMHLWVRKDG